MVQALKLCQLPALLVNLSRYPESTVQIIFIVNPKPEAISRFVSFIDEALPQLILSCAF